MGKRAFFGLFVLLLCVPGCIVVAGSNGISVRSIPTLITECGPRPSRQVIDTLVRAECGNVTGLRLRCSAPVRRWVLDHTGSKVYGWYVTATVTPSSQRHSYMVYKRKHGFAIIAHAHPHGLTAKPFQLVWERRDLVAIDRRLALLHTQRELRQRLEEQKRKIEAQKHWIAKQRERDLEHKLKRERELRREQARRDLERQRREQQRLTKRKLAERSREWKIMTRRPTPEERKHANYGPRPKQAKQTIRIHLARILKEADHADNADIKIYQPSKTWGRVQGTAELAFGWSVRVRVRIKKKGERPLSKFYYFMFRGEKIVSTTREGLGYRLLAAKPATPATPATPARRALPATPATPARPTK